jgi:hypothetical protein
MTSAAKSLDPTDCFLEGYQAGSDMAVDMARAGNLRVAALPFECGHYPYSRPLRPWKITRLAWASWWRERTNRG